MVKILCNFHDMTLDILDDAESTPGQSEQLAMFRHFVLLAMKRRWAGLSRDDALRKLSEVSAMPVNCGFRLVSSESRNGTAILTYEFGEDE